MKFETVEVADIEEMNAQKRESQFRELNDLQLAFIGGGIGDPIAF